MLRTKYLIVGSGLSSYVFLKTLNKEKIKDCLVITGKDTNYKKEELFNKKKMDIDISNNFGGLGKTWLGGYSTFDSHEIKNKMPNSLEIIKLFKTYKRDKLLDYNLNNSKSFPSYILDLKRIKSKKLNFFDINLVNDFINNKNAILRPKKVKDTKYLNGQLIDMNLIDDNYISKIKYGKKFISIKSKYIFLACGTISTTKILMRINVLKNKCRIKHQPYFYGFYAIKNLKNKIYKNIKMPILNYSFQDKSFSLQGTIGSFNKRINKIINDKFLNIFNINTFKKFFFNNFIFFNAFVNSSKSKLYLIKSEKNFKLNTLQTRAELKNLSKKINHEIKKILLKNKINIFLNKLIIPKFGYDKHYFGSINYTNNKIIKKNSELKKYKNIFVIDQSVLDFDTNKFVTLIALFNSIIVGKTINKKD